MYNCKKLLRLSFIASIAISTAIILASVLLTFPSTAFGQQENKAITAKKSTNPFAASKDRQIISSDFDAAILDAGTSTALSLDNQSDRHVVRVGLYENKPKIYTDSSGKAAGIFVEILDGIAKREHWDISYVHCQWDDCLKALHTGEIDLMPDVAYSKQRNKTMSFNKETVLEGWSQVYANKNIPIKNISDLNGRKIAVLSGSIEQHNLQRMMQGFGYKVTFINCSTFDQAFRKVENGTADVVVSNNFFGDYFYRQYDLTRTAIVFNPVALYFATAHGAKSKLLHQLDDAIRSMKSEPGSVFYMAQEHWLINQPKAVVPRYLIWILGGIVGGFIVSVVVIIVLRRMVVLRTRHLVQANELLQDSEEKFRKIFHNHSAVKLLVDPESGAIIEVNRAAEKFYGWNSGELQGKKIQDIRVGSGDDNVNIDSNSRHIKSRHRLASGEIKDVEIFSSKVEIHGKLFLHYIIHDVTELRKLEEQYRQAQKMESVGRLAGGVAHDYNNMLGIILGYTELALIKIGGSEPLHGYLEEIHNAAKRSSDITRQLLAFARKQSINPQTVYIDSIIDNMIKMLRRLIGEDIELDWNPGRDLKPIKIDPSQFEQIVINLCVNARDAISGVGKIAISTSQVALSKSVDKYNNAYGPGDFIKLEVVDNGAGMNQATIDNIFEPFFTTKGQDKGTGLGLATVYGIVQQSGGFIQVQSEVGQGTKFKVYLPCCIGEHKEDTADDVIETPSGHNELILLVEDDPAIRKMAEIMLGRLGYKVLVSGTAKEALQKVEELAGDLKLVITDVIMPEMNGRELANQLNDTYPNIKVLFMSGYSEDVISTRGMLDKQVELIQKPFTMQALGAKVREILGTD